MAELHPIVVHMRELKASPMWEMFTAACLEMQTNETNRMLSANRDEFDYHKGRIEAFRDVIQLPDMLIKRWI